jgi:hypothetical protein
MSAFSEAGDLPGPASVADATSGVTVGPPLSAVVPEADDAAWDNGACAEEDDEDDDITTCARCALGAGGVLCDAWCRWCDSDAASSLLRCGACRFSARPKVQSP